MESSCDLYLCITSRSFCAIAGDLDITDSSFEYDPFPGVLYSAELGLRAEGIEGRDRAVTADSSGRSGSHGGSQNHLMLTGVMGTLDRVRRKHHTASSPILSHVDQSRVLNL